MLAVILAVRAHAELDVCIVILGFPADRAAVDGTGEPDP